MPLIAPDVVRMTVKGSLFGQEILNVFDAAVTNLEGVSRAEACFLITGDLLNQWADHICPLLTVNYTFEEVRWLDLDSPTGSVGTRVSTDGTTLPISGTGTGTPVANHTYAKIRKEVEGSNRQRRTGVLRLSGITEPQTADGNGNEMKLEPLEALNAAFEDLKDGINTGLDQPFTANLVVVHTVNRVYAGRSDIANYRCQFGLGTLRRRMPGYGN